MFPSNGLVSILKKRVCVKETENPTPQKELNKRKVRFREPDDAFDQGTVSSHFCYWCFTQGLSYIQMNDLSSSFSFVQISRLETLALCFSSCVWLRWWLAWVGLLYIVSLERRTQTCAWTSRKTWNFTLDLYDEEWTLSHSGSLLVHHSRFYANLSGTLSLYYHFRW